MRPHVLLASTLWWPLSARLAMRFLRYGCEVSAICPRGHVLGYVPGIRQLYDYRSLDSLSSLEAALDSAKPDMVIPCDDRVVWQLHELHSRRPHLRALIERSLGRASEYDIVARRARLLETARSLGVRVPETRNVLSESDVRDWFARAPGRSVLKIDGTWGGNGVEIVDTEEQAVRAYAQLARPSLLALAVKRWLINRDPLALWTWNQERAPITIQRFVSGRPANAMVACWRGEALASVIVEVLSSQGSTGAGLVVRVVRNLEIARAARVLAERLGLTGYYGLDFIIDAETGGAHLIEMNPRCTQLGHLAVSEQGDLAGALYSKLSNAPVEAPPLIGSDVVAFFPQAVQAEPQSRYSKEAYLDVPVEHAEVVRELLLPPPPERQLMTRLYHSVRPPRDMPTVDF